MGEQCDRIVGNSNNKGPSGLGIIRSGLFFLVSDGASNEQTFTNAVRCSWHPVHFRCHPERYHTSISMVWTCNSHDDTHWSNVPFPSGRPLHRPGRRPQNANNRRAMLPVRMLKRTDASHIDDRDLYSGFIRMHILHHAVEGPVFGLAMQEELARHGYRISLGSLYPLLHTMEQKGYLTSSEHRNGKSLRRVYRATPAGKQALKSAKLKVRELFSELIADGGR